MAPRRPSRRRLWPAWVLAGVAAAAYLNTIFSDFVFDDTFAVVGAA